MQITVLDRVSDFAPHEAAWTDLANCCDEVNPFYELWMLRPALTHLTASGVEIVLAYEGEVLCGVFPIASRRHISVLSLRGLALWRHEHSALGLPLLRRGRERETLREFLNWFEVARTERFVLFEYLPSDGVVRQSIEGALAESGRAVFPVEDFERAAFHPPKSVEEYLRDLLPRHRRKEHARVRKRWAETGVLQLVIYDAQVLANLRNHDAVVKEWVERFIELENMGWKGVAGSALGRRTAEAEYFRAVCHEAADRGRLLLFHLEFQGKPVAMKCDIISRSNVFTYKITFDEQFAKFSPGVLLELDHMRYFEAKPEFTMVDSCAVPKHSMIERLWRERRKMVSILSHRKGSVPRLVVRWILPMMRNMRKRLTQRAVSDSEM